MLLRRPRKGYLNGYGKVFSYCIQLQRPDPPRSSHEVESIAMMPREEEKKRDVDKDTETSEAAQHHPSISLSTVSTDSKLNVKGAPISTPAILNIMHCNLEKGIEVLIFY